MPPKQHLPLALFGLCLFSGCDWIKKKLATQETPPARVSREKIFVHEETEMKTVLPTDVQTYDQIKFTPQNNHASQNS